MIGQKRAKALFSNMTLATMPRSILLVAPFGAGKRTFIAEQAARFGVSVEDVTSRLTDSDISAMMKSVEPTFYVIDLDSLTERDQNTLLKCVEEPVAGAYFFLIATTDGSAIPTIANRCMRIEFENYSVEELRPFLAYSGDESLAAAMLEACSTPGQLLAFDSRTAPDLFALCDKMAEAMGKASLANALTIVGKVNCKEEYSKFDFQLFMAVLGRAYAKRSFAGDALALRSYEIVRKARMAARDSRISRENLLTAMIADLHKEATKHEGKRA